PDGWRTQTPSAGLAAGTLCWLVSASNGAETATWHFDRVRALSRRGDNRLANGPSVIREKHGYQIVLSAFGRRSAWSDRARIKFEPHCPADVHAPAWLGARSARQGTGRYP